MSKSGLGNSKIMNGLITSNDQIITDTQGLQGDMSLLKDTLQKLGSGKEKQERCSYRKLSGTDILVDKRSKNR